MDRTPLRLIEDEQDAPGYKKGSGLRLCGNCKFASNGFCEKYDFEFTKGFTCDAWAPLAEDIGLPLDEAKIARVYEHYADTGFAIFTSWRPDTTSHPDEPDTNPKTGKPTTRADNKKNLKELKRALVKKNLGFIPMKGVWDGSSEPSLFVPAKRKGSKDIEADRAYLRKVSIALGKHYNQDAVVWSPGGKVQLIATAPDGREGKVGTVLMRWGGFSPKAVGMAYSSLKTKRSPKKAHQLPKAERGFKFVKKAASGAGQGQAQRAIASSVEFQGYFFDKAPRSFMEAIRREAEGEIVFVRS